jgi:hypothetical protein
MSDGFQPLWLKIKHNTQPIQGIPFDPKDPILSPSVPNFTNLKPGVAISMLGSYAKDPTPDQLYKTGFKSKSEDDQLSWHNGVQHQESPKFLCNTTSVYIAL